MNQTEQHELERKVLGVLMTQPQRVVFEYLNQLKPEYFTSGLYLDIYKTIAKMMDSFKKTDLMSVIEQMKADGKAQGKTIISISQTTSNLPQLQHLIDPLFRSIVMNYNKRTVGNWLNVQNKKYNNDRLALESFISDVEKVKDSIDYGSAPTRDILDVFDDVLESHDKAKNGERTGIRLGHAVLTDVIELEPVDVLVIAARPGSGKTAFAISTAKNLCIQDELQVALFVIEMSEQQLVRRLQSNLARVDSKKIRKGTCKEDELQKIREWKSNNNIKNLHIFTGDHRVEDIAFKCTKLKNTVGLDLIIVDYVQKVTSSLKGNATETDQVKQVTDDLKRITQRLEVPQIQLSQLKRNESRGGNRPQLSDIKQTTAIEENASIVGFLHRPELYGHKTMPDNPNQSSRCICEFVIAKNREDESDIVRQFYFEPWYSSFSSVTDSMVTIENKAKKDDDLPF